MNATTSKSCALSMKLISAAVSSCFACTAALGNPTGGVPVAGSVSMATPAQGQLHITNSPNSIIHWQGFSIGAGELTRFIQQSPSSAVLNRVVTNSPSDILGTLESNGRVFLINPNGIVFGPGSVVDVAGLVASSLNLTDANFLSGRYLFDSVPGAGRVDNFGSIQAGQVYLVGPAVSNGGLITSPQGEVVLAAGNSVELMNTGTPGLSVSISAGAHEALNLGSILADSGRVGIFAGLVTQAGSVQANTAVAGADGSIKLVATGATVFTSGSSTFATGPMSMQTGDLTVAGTVQSGTQAIDASGKVAIRNEQPQGIAQLLAVGGQRIRAQSLELTAAEGGLVAIANFSTGDQIITIEGGGASPGIDVRALSSGGAATIGSYAPGAAQTISVRDADHINVNGIGEAGPFFNGAFIFANGVQTISITGSGANAINLGSVGARSRSILEGVSQHITAGEGFESGSITIIGSNGDARFSGITSQPAGASGVQTVSTTGTISVIAGNALAKVAGQATAIAHNTIGPQTVSANRLVIQGGSSGSGNRANVGVQNGPQLINVGQGGIEMMGGSDGTNNQALIFAGSGLQTITTSSASLTAGAGGTGNYAVIVAPRQEIAVSGNLTLTGGGSLANPAAGGGALIGGGNTFPTNLNMIVGGDVTLNGGYVVDSGAALGTGLTGVLRTDITMNVGGNVTLNPGAATGTRIGSRPENMAGGDIVINAGGAVVLNSAGPGNAGAIRTADGVTLRARSITQGPDAVIQADTLTLGTQEGALLVGANAVNALRATNAWFGDVALHNSSPLLTVADVQNFAGTFVLRQQGDVLVNGGIFSGPQSIDVSGGLVVQNDPGMFAQVIATGGQAIRAGHVEVNGMGGGSAAIANFGGEQSIETSSANAAGEGLAVRAFDGGFAVIDSPQGAQSIIVRNAERMVVGGGNGFANISAFGMPQSIVLTGADANALVMGGGTAGQAIILGGNQTVQAGQDGESGSITLLGNSEGFSTGIFANQIAGGSQSISTPGALTVVGGSTLTGFDSGIFADGGVLQQSVSAGSITLAGGSAGTGNGAVIFSNAQMQSVRAGAGGILVAGGSGASNTDAGIYANNGSQLVESGAGGITLLGGAVGANNFAQINQQSSSQAATQTVRSAGPVLLQSGDGNLNFTMIRAFGGHQDLTFGDTTLLAGASGIDNFAAILSRNQDMTVHGELALVGRGSADSPTVGGGVRIGGVGGAAPSATSLRLNVDGGLTMTGGSVARAGAGLGNTRGFTGTTDISVNVGGDVVLNGGTTADTLATIGSRAANLAGGAIDISAGGGIALNSSAPDAAAVIRTTDGVTLRAREISQGAVAKIEAGSLTIQSAQGVSLVGMNAVNSLHASNAASGAFTFNNASPLLTVTGIQQVPNGALSLNQAGNLLVTGNVSSGVQNIAAMGDITITPGQGPNVEVHANGAQSFTAGGKFSLLGGSAWNVYAQATSTGPLQVSTGGDLTVQGGSGLLAYGLLYGKDDIRLTVGNELHVDGGSGLLAFARVQTDFRDRIYLSFPNRASGGYFVNGREGVTYMGLDGFFAGLLPARPGRSLIVSYGQ